MEEKKSYVYQFWGGFGKAFIGSTLLVLCGFIILAMSVLTLYEKSGAFESSATPSSMSATVNYYLPYPGVLPDNPFYKIKALRDKIVLWLTVSDTAKADKELLYADKRIGAAKILVEGGKKGLGVSTATKAEKYLESAFGRLDKVSRGGIDVKSQLLTLKTAIAKHQEILEGIVGMTEGSDRNVAEQTLKLNKLLQQKINQTWIEAK